MTTMSPTVFDGRFGWLHPAPGTCGVVICNPFGHEAMWLHRSLRQLAQRLAEQGLPSLRFDYAGCGDSAAGEADAISGGTADIAAAAQHLRELAGVTRVVLLGVRMGATLAALAAAQVGADALVMLEPVVSGKAYWREQTVLRQVAAMPATPPGDATSARDGHCQVLGYDIDAATIEQLRLLDLRAATPHPAPNVLILATAGNTAVDVLAQSYRACGASVEQQAFAGFDAMLQPAWLSRAPREAFETVLRWLVRQPAHVILPSVATNAGAASTPVIALDGARERPVSFDARGLFGMLCEPDRNQVPGLAILLPNTGCTPHAGESRFAVRFARRMASAGIATLRIDVSGLGDSEAAGRWDEAPLPLAGACSDTACAAAWLAARGYRRVIVLGICTGAYLALRAASGEPSIAGLILVNLPRFAFPADCTIQDVGFARKGSTRRHLKSMLEPGKWREVARGQVSLAPVVATMLGYAVRRCASLLGAPMLARRRGGAAGLLRDLDARGVQTRLLYSPDDVGLDDFRLNFGAGGRRLKRLPNARAAVIDELDHELANRAAQALVTEYCVGMLRECFGVGDAGMADGAKQPTMPERTGGLLAGAECGSARYG